MSSIFMAQRSYKLFMTLYMLCRFEADGVGADNMTKEHDVVETLRSKLEAVEASVLAGHERAWSK